MTRRRLVLAILAALCGLTSCGLPPTRHFERIPAKRVPFGLLSPAASEAPTPATTAASAPIYFVLGRRLTVVRRASGGEAGPVEAITLLLGGPTAGEARDGLTSDIPAQTRLVSLRLVGGTAAVDLSSQFGAIGGNAQVLAVAQIVFTLTAAPGVHAVRFAVNRHSIDVPDATGSLSPLPRTRAEYRGLLSGRS